MKSFKISKSYILLLFCIAITFFLMFVYSLYTKGSVTSNAVYENVWTFLTFIISLSIFLVAVYSLTVKVDLLDNGIIRKSSILPSTEISLHDVNSVNLMDLRGRYIVMLLTSAQFIAISTVIKDFDTLLPKIRAQISDDSQKVLDTITVDILAKKNRNMFLILVVTLLLSLALLFYRVLTL